MSNLRPDLKLDSYANTQAKDLDSKQKLLSVIKH